jgi:predicted amidohydrolase YtcJ
MIAWPRTTANGRQLGDWKIKETSPNALTYLSGIKYMIDGTPMEENALRTFPYPNRPNWYGRLNYPIDTIKQILREALMGNQQLMLHITADSSFSVVLSLMKQMGSSEVWRTKRVRIEHNHVGDLAGNISASNRQLLKEMGILMMHTPKYSMISPLRSLLEGGVVVGISPDGTTNPFFEIMLVTSTHANPKENLTREQAVIAYTKTNAYAEFTEDQKGTLTQGKLADLAVLSQDIFTIPTEQLMATRSVLTIVDGKIVYQQAPNQPK